MAGIGTTCSYRDFVDDALFHPDWGYYSTGQVRFGDGGHYDTFPIALSPYFGRIVAANAFQRWHRVGRPDSFEIAEIGAGNGQLCLDTMLSIRQRATREPWRRFARAVRYRILERSPGLIARQRRQLAGTELPVDWTRIDPSRGRPRKQPFAEHGLIVANEVLDCLSHHKIVPGPGGPQVVHVAAFAGRRLLTRAELASQMCSPRGAAGVQFKEVALPLSSVAGLDRFLRHYAPFVFSEKTRAPYFACPDIPVLMRNTAALFRSAEALWIDYGDEALFHRRVAENRKVFAGPPRSGNSVFDAPGRDDITFMVDFTAAARAALDEGWHSAFYGPQGELAARTDVFLDAKAEDEILQYRGLKWLLAISGTDPERDWRAGSVSFRGKAGRGGSVRADVRRTIAEFTGHRPSYFRVLILTRG